MFSYWVRQDRSSTNFTYCNRYFNVRFLKTFWSRADKMPRYFNANNRVYQHHFVESNLITTHFSLVVVRATQHHDLIYSE